MANEFIARNGVISKSNVIVSGSLTALSNIVAQTLVVQTITSSISSITGSTNFGSLVSNTHTFTGSINTSGSILTSGSIGIGTTPSYPLHIFKSSEPEVALQSSNTMFRVGVNSSNECFLYTSQTQPIYFSTSGSERVRITSAGNVGIGVASPNGLLQLNGAIANSGDAATFTIKQSSTTYTNGIYLERSGERNGYYMYVGGAVDSLTFRRNYFGTQSDVMSLTRDGSVGIGTTNPSQKLEVYTSSGDVTIKVKNASSTGAARLLLNPEGAGAGSSGDGSIFFDMNTTAWLAGVDKSDSSKFKIANDVYGDFSTNVYMTITTGGNVLVGQTSSDLNVNGWQLQGVGGGHTSFAINNNEAFIFNNRNTGTTYQIDFRTNLVERGAINVTDSGTSYSTTSDYRVKEDFKDINGLEKVSAIKVYDFKFKDLDERMDGVIAHELQEVLPYAVYGEKDGAKFQGVDYSRIVPVLIKSIQELTARVQELENK